MMLLFTNFSYACGEDDCDIQCPRITGLVVVYTNFECDCPSDNQVLESGPVYHLCNFIEPMKEFALRQKDCKKFNFDEIDLPFLNVDMEFKLFTGFLTVPITNGDISEDAILFKFNLANNGKFFYWDFAPFFLFFECNTRKSFLKLNYTRFVAFLHFNKFVNNGSPEIYSWNVNSLFRYWDRNFDGIFFPERAQGLDVIQFSEDMSEMRFNYFDYDYFADFFHAYHNLTSEEVFQFAFVPFEGSHDPYDPVYMRLVFSRIEIE